MKTSIDQPTGCSIIPIKAPKIKLESMRYRFTKWQIALSSGWRALRKIRFSPRVSANGSFSHQSMAYVHASTKYLKQVSGLLKTGVTTSLRNSSSSYEAVQGTQIRRLHVYDLFFAV